jgi:hypothetical protein
MLNEGYTLILKGDDTRVLGDRACSVVLLKIVFMLLSYLDF